MSKDIMLERLHAALEQAPAPKDVLEWTTPRAAGPVAYAEAPWEAIQAEWKALGMGVRVAHGRDQARQTLSALLGECGPGPVIRWDSPALTGLGLDELLAQNGMPLAQGDGRFVDTAKDAVLGVTGADCLVAETGTIAVLAGPGRERSASLLPPRHLAVVTPDTAIVPDIPAIGAWLETLASQTKGMPSAVHFITGPSATADIELIKVNGIHGPVAMDVLLVLPEI